MDNQQLYAKIGVFVLLGVNVGAYYMFWPRDQGGSVRETTAPRESKGEVVLFPDPTVMAPKVAKPKELAAGVSKDAAPVQNPDRTKKPASDVLAADELVRKLIEHMEKETRPDAPPQESPGAQKKDAAAPRPLPPLQADPLLGTRKDLDPAKVGVTSPLVPNPLPSPWVLQTEPVGKQTLLIAKLQGATREVAEFRILCERIENKENEVLALGNVAFTGPGLRGECHRLTLPLLESRLVFDDQVRLVQGAGTLRGDRITWEVNATVIQGNFNVNPAVLGPPK
ncbi:MAG: hypothetical protein EXR98_09780 [Gemmataceae bacterium]|nr:hypothetical protein [Gemmataceae bacterium]